jgi:non-haem Fe2+, alpha-ketoglutarate-dependent halogenase
VENKEMTKTLSDAQVRYFREQGWLAPLRAMDSAEAADCVARIAAYEVKMGESANRSLKIKGHLAMPWLVAVARSPGILDALEDLIGPDTMLFGASIFAKGGKDRAYVSWHQDSAYFGLHPHEEITAWVAFTDSNAENGALQVLPRTHLGADLPHEETYASDNMLARGQSLQIGDDSSAVTIELKAGEFSLHHERTAHGSKPNRSAAPRIGFAFFYIPTHVCSTIGRRSATVVRGVDNYGHWDADPLPQFDLDPVALAVMRSAWGQYRDGEVKQAAEA